MPAGESQGIEAGRDAPSSPAPREPGGSGSTARPLARTPLWIAGTVGALVGVVAVVAWSRRAADPDRYFREARAALDAKQTDRAAAAVRKLEALREPTPFDRLLRAQVDEALGRPDDALAELSRVEAPHPLAPVARLLAGQIEVRRHRLRAAEALFLEAVALEPKAVQAHREL